LLYSQRNKEETILFSVMKKRLFGEYLTSVLVRTQNRELAFRCIAYNMHRVTNLLLLWVMVSTRPINKYHSFYTKKDLQRIGKKLKKLDESTENNIEM
jgi:hypothetical protein